MTATIVYAVSRKVKDLYTLIRFLPVLSWGLSSSLVGSTLGIKSTPLVALLYFLLALLLGGLGIIFSHPVFWITVLSALGCMAAVLATNPEDITSVTNKEYLLYWLIIGDAVVKMLWLLTWPVYML